MGHPQPDGSGRSVGGRRATAEQVSQESRNGRRKDGKTAPGAERGPAKRTEAGAPPDAGKDARQARDGAATTGGRQIMGDLRRLWKHGNHQPADAYNSHVEETEGKERVHLRPSPSSQGGSAPRARGEDGQAGDRHIGPDPASRDEDPLAGPLAVAVHEVEPGEAGPRANKRGAALTQNGPNRELKSLILQEGTVHAFHAMGGLNEGKEGVTLFKLTLSMEAPAKATIREILTQFTESSMIRLIGARLRPERSHRPLPKELQQLLRPEQ